MPEDIKEKEVIEKEPEDESIQHKKPEEKEKKKSEKLFTQDDVNKMMQERLARHEETLRKKLGIDKGLQELVNERNELAEFRERVEQEQEERRQEDLKKRGEHEQLLRERDHKIKEMDAQHRAELDAARTLYRDEVVTRALMDAYAQNGGHPKSQSDAVTVLLRGPYKFEVSENREIEILDMAGNRATDGEGNHLTIDQMVKNFLRERSWFRQSPASQGSGIHTAVDSPDLLSDQDKWREMRRLIDEGKLSGQEIAKKLGINQ